MKITKAYDSIQTNTFSDGPETTDETKESAGRKPFQQELDFLDSIMAYIGIPEEWFIASQIVGVVVLAAVFGALGLVMRMSWIGNGFVLFLLIPMATRFVVPGILWILEEGVGIRVAEASKVGLDKEWLFWI